MRKTYTLLLTVGFLLYVLYSHGRYTDVLEENERLIQEHNEMFTNYNNNFRTVLSEYEDLADKYGDLLAENDRLKYQIETTAIPEYDFTYAEIVLLAECVQCEAGYNSESQRNITQVILNRVKSSDYPDTIEEVIYQKIQGVPQFSVAYDGKMDNCEVVRPETLLNVYEVIVHGNDLPEDVLFFYSSSLETDNWIKTLNVYSEVGGTLFCRR